MLVKMENPSGGGGGSSHYATGTFTWTYVDSTTEVAVTCQDSGGTSFTPKTVIVINKSSANNKYEMVSIENSDLSLDLLNYYTSAWSTGGTGNYVTIGTNGFTYKGPQNSNYNGECMYFAID